MIFETPWTHGALKNIGRAVDEHVDGLPWCFGAASDAQRGQMEDVIDAVHGRVHCIGVANVAIDDDQVAESKRLVRDCVDCRG